MNLGEWSDNAPPGSVAVLEDWINNLRKLGDRGKAVQLSFIEEKRVPKKVMKKFLVALVKEYDRVKSENPSDPDLPLQAIEEAVNPDEGLQGCLKVSQDAPVPGNILHFISFEKMKRLEYFYYAIGAVDPPRYVEFNRGLGMGRDGTKGVPYIWITFSYADKSFNGMNATAIRDALGMSDVEEDDYLYKVDILSSPVEALRIPTVLDAKGNPAWFPAPEDSPWGITRNLNTDAEEFPELLRESLPSKALAPKGELVCDRNGKASWTSAANEDYLKLRMKKFRGKL